MTPMHSHPAHHGHHAHDAHDAPSAPRLCLFSPSGVSVKAAPVRLADGLWRSVLAFPDLPLHSGDYVISVYLFDGTGLAVYDEWFQFLHFSFIFPKALPGLVRLPHRWS